MNRFEVPTTIRLTEDEEKILEDIAFDLGSVDHEKLGPILNAAASLAKSLIGRSAIPEVRRRYFTDPALNFGASRSRLEVFEANGTRGEDILRHPHFLKHLRYFIYGPHLPASSIAGFCRIVSEDAGTSGMVLDQLRRYVRSEVRKGRMNPPEAAEEFHKLALEIGLGDNLCRAVRDAARSNR